MKDISSKLQKSINYNILSRSFHTRVFAFRNTSFSIDILSIYIHNI